MCIITGMQCSHGMNRMMSGVCVCVYPQSTSMADQAMAVTLGTIFELTPILGLKGQRSKLQGDKCESQFYLQSLYILFCQPIKL